MKTQEFIQRFQEEKIENTRFQPNAVKEFIEKNLEVKSYIPFLEKKEIIKTIVGYSVKEIDGIKHNNQIDQYLSFVMAMLVAHTNLEIGTEPANDYDTLCQSGLLTQIIDTFQTDYSECDILLKMAVAQELEDNNLNNIVAKFLEDILNRLDIVGNTVKSTVGDINLKDMLEDKFNEEDLAALSQFLHKENK